jgi:hypothetical protein
MNHEPNVRGGSWFVVRSMMAVCVGVSGVIIFV